MVAVHSSFFYVHSYKLILQHAHFLLWMYLRSILLLPPVNYISIIIIIVYRPSGPLSSLFLRLPCLVFQVIIHPLERHCSFYIRQYTQCGAQSIEDPNQLGNHLHPPHPPHSLSPTLPGPLYIWKTFAESALVLDGLAQPWYTWTWTTTVHGCIKLSIDTPA